MILDLRLVGHRNASSLFCSWLGRRSPLTSSLLVLNNGYRCIDELNSAVEALIIGPSVQFAMIIQVILVIESVFVVKLVGKFIETVSMGPSELISSLLDHVMLRLHGTYVCLWQLRCSFLRKLSEQLG